MSNEYQVFPHSVLVTHDSVLLLRLLVQGAFIIFRAEFRVFYSARLFSFVFRRRVIPHFADGTLECNNVSHDVCS
jgi:hypothetical protein